MLDLSCVKAQNSKFSGLKVITPANKVLLSSDFPCKLKVKQFSNSDEHRSKSLANTKSVPPKPKTPFPFEKRKVFAFFMQGIFASFFKLNRKQLFVSPKFLVFERSQASFANPPNFSPEK